MNDMIERDLIEAAILRQAAEVAYDAIGKTIITSMRGAQVCGCRNCRRAAGEATLWAALMMEPGPAGGLASPADHA
jgi:hypothetical protein